jgi:hypothetical protein
VSPRVDTAEPLSLELEDFVKLVRTGQRRPADVELAQDVVNLIEATEASIASGGDQVMFSPVSAARR